MLDQDYKSLPSIQDIVNNTLHLRTARIINRRIEGASLSDVAAEESLTRAETRSIEKKGLEKIFSDELEVREDEYKYLYENYSFDDDFYLSLYNGKCILYYLKNRYELGLGSIDFALEDSQISDKILNELKSFYNYKNSSIDNSIDCLISNSNESSDNCLQFDSCDTPKSSSLISDIPTYTMSLDSNDTSSLPQYVRDAISELWSTFQACGITEPHRIIEQASLFFFLKYLDDSELKNTAEYLSNCSAAKSLYFDDAHQDCRWSFFHNLESTELFCAFNSNIIPFIKNDLSVDTNLTYPKLAKNLQFLIADSTLLTKIVSSIDSITASSHTNLFSIFEVFLSLANIDLRVMDLVCQALNISINDNICNAFPANDFSLSSIASYIKKEKKDDLNKIWNKMHFQNEMLHTFNTDNHTLLISSLRLLLQDIPNPDIQPIDIITSDCAVTFSKVIAKIPAKPTINQKYVRPSIRSVVTANIPSLMYMFGCHEILEDNGICLLYIPHRNLIEDSASHRRLRELYVRNNTILGIINLPAYNRDLLIYQKTKPCSFHQTLFAQIYDLTDGLINNVCSLIHSSEVNEDYINREDYIFYVPDFELESNNFNLGFETYSLTTNNISEQVEETEALDIILRRIYNTQAEIDKSIVTLKTLLEKL